jgi:hypothetical protein
VVDPRYRPGRRRSPIVALLLNWAAGVLVAILITMLGLGLMQLFVEPGLARLGALVTVTFIAWPLGAALGVWLSAEPPLRARVLVYALASCLVGTAIVSLPIWIDIDADVVRGVSGIAALLLAPVFARLGIGLVRRRIG